MRRDCRASRPIGRLPAVPRARSMRGVVGSSWATPSTWRYRLGSGRSWRLRWVAAPALGHGSNPDLRGPARPAGTAAIGMSLKRRHGRSRIQRWISRPFSSILEHRCRCGDGRLLQAHLRQHASLPRRLQERNRGPSAEDAAGAVGPPVGPLGGAITGKCRVRKPSRPEAFRDRRCDLATDASNPPAEHETGARHPVAARGRRNSLSLQLSRLAGLARHRQQLQAFGHLRPRLLLARPRGLPEGNGTEAKSQAVAREVAGKSPA